MKVGIIGTGKIASTIADTLNAMQEVEAYAIASRSIDKAEGFARKHNINKAYGSYEELLQDKEVELVYVATPHSHHFECMKMSVLAHKNVICEKAFTMNANQAREIAELATDKKVYLAEAIWPRYMPSRKIINDILLSKVIGDVRMMTANLSYVISGNPRIVDPSLAGGALLDVGVYGINFMLMHLGKDIGRIESSVQMTDRGVDGQESITVSYNDGTMAVLTHGIFSRSDRKGIFYGEKGYIVVENINNPKRIAVYDLDDNPLDIIDVPPQISGYEYEFLEAKRCIEEGMLQSDSMPLSESIFMMEIMDRIRDIWGLKYPGEENV